MEPEQTEQKVETPLEFQVVDKPKSKKWLWIVLIIVIIGAAAAYWYFKMGPGKPVAKTATPATSDEVAVSDPTADWLTYTNTTYGFSYKYPSNFTADAGARALLDNMGAICQTISMNTNSSLMVCDTAANLTTYGLQGPDGLGNPTVTDLTVGGQPAKKYLTSSVSYVVLSPRNNRIVLTSSNVAAENISTLETLLSTFQFTAPSATADWKTYTNATYGLSVMYPNNWTGSVQHINSVGDLFSWAAESNSGMFDGVTLDVSSKTSTALITDISGQKTQSSQSTNGLTWTVLTVAASAADNSPASKSYYVVHAGKTFVLTCSTEASMTNLDNMVQTFQFTS